MRQSTGYRVSKGFWNGFSLSMVCFLLLGCASGINGLNHENNGDSGQCLSNCIIGSGTRGLRVFVEPDAGPEPLLSAIREARTSVDVEMYLLSNSRVMRALEDAANRGLRVRVMLEPHPYGSGPTSVIKTLDRLNAAGVYARTSDPAFALTHAKAMVLDGTTAFIMTSNFTNSALGSGKYMQNREYDIIDTDQQDVQAVREIFQADWDHSTANFDDANLVVSPVNARHAIEALIASARHTLLIEAEEMNDSEIEQALVNATRRGVRVEVILPASSGSASVSGSDVLKQGGVEVREDTQLYMHAKIIVCDGARAFVGSENLSAQSLGLNRELGIIVADSGVLHTLEQTFEQDWSISPVV